MKNAPSRIEGRYSFVPAVDDILSPPPSPPDETDAKPLQPYEAGLGFVVVTANVLVTGIIIIAMLVDGQQASRSIVTGSVYFALTTTLYVFIHTGALSAIVTVWQRERTERRRIDAYAETALLALQWRIRIEETRVLELQAQATPSDFTRRLAQLEHSMLERGIAGGVQTPTAQSTFVAPYDDQAAQSHGTVAQEALAWAQGLYLDTTGEPDPAQVHISGEQEGWLRVRMLGSRRGTGSKDAGLWLLHRKVILRVPGGYKLNLKTFPRRESLRALL